MAFFSELMKMSVFINVLINLEPSPSYIASYIAKA